MLVVKKKGPQDLVNTRPSHRAEEAATSPSQDGGDRDVGARLREIRGARSREDFAAELSLHRNTVERYEKSKRPIDAALLRLVIEKNPGWSLHWLMTGRGSKRAAAAEHRLAEPEAPGYGTRLDDQLLANVMREIEAAFGANYSRITVEKRAALIASVYDDARARGGEVSRDAVMRLVKLASFP